MRTRGNRNMLGLALQEGYQPVYRNANVMLKTNVLHSVHISSPLRNIMVQGWEDSKYSG